MIEEFSATVAMIDRLLEVVNSLQRVEESVALAQELTNMERAKHIHAQRQDMGSPKKRGKSPVKIGISLSEIIKTYQ